MKREFALRAYVKPGAHVAAAGLVGAGVAFVILTGVARLINYFRSN